MQGGGLLSALFHSNLNKEDFRSCDLKEKTIYKNSMNLVSEKMKREGIINIAVISGLLGVSRDQAKRAIRSRNEFIELIRKRFISSL